MFNKITEFFDRRFSPVKLVPAGIYQHTAPAEADPPYKLHLRVEENGEGVLIINARTVLHLNRSAAEFAYYLVQGKQPDEIRALEAERYDADAEQIGSDLEDFIGQINTLIATEDLDPVSYLSMERVAPYSGKLSAPYRLDCALTYRVSAGTAADAAPAERVSRELSADEWKTILDKVWGAGIPHVNFTGGEPTLREDLSDLIDHAEQLGIVTGLLTDGLRLADREYANGLLDKGLDHIMMLAQPEHKDFWKALANLMPESIAVTVHATLTPENRASFNGLLDRLAAQDVTSVSLSARDSSLAEGLELASQHATHLGMQTSWDLPVPYSGLNPVALELQAAERGIPKGAGNAWLYVEPDGDVLPEQGVNRVLGNLLSDPWEKIWKKH